MKLSKSQTRAIEEIDKLNESFGEKKWFIQEELLLVGGKTLWALVQKGVLKTKKFGNKDQMYYQDART